MSPEALAQGDYLFLIVLKPPELRVAKPFFSARSASRHTTLAVLYTHPSTVYTSKYRPWKVVMYLCFEDERRAAEFERYLKTGSGQAFANKRLW